MQTTAEEMGEKLAIAVIREGLNLNDMHQVVRILSRSGFNTRQINVFSHEAIEEACERLQKDD
jgi:hypothetical protein